MLASSGVAVPVEMTFIPRRHRLGAPKGMEERRMVMYSRRHDYIRLAEVQAQEKKRI